MNAYPELTISLVQMKLSFLNNYLEWNPWLLERASILVSKEQVSLVRLFQAFQVID
jgi:hypothetical protein